MAFEGWQSKINVLVTVRQRVPGCRTGVGKLPSAEHGQNSVCISGYPDLSVNFMAAKNPDILK